MTVPCVLYKDVEGVFTADPSIVPEAHLIKEISYEEMLEMASQGAKVVNSYAVEVAWINKIPLFITSLANPHRGTLIH